MSIQVPVLTPAETRDAHVAAGHWSEHETLTGRLATHVRERPEAVAVVDGTGARLTYADLDDQSSRLAAAFAARGIGIGDVVGLQVPNRHEGVVAALAIEK